MLQDFRENISGAAKFIVILIAIPFAFFGIESIFFTGASVEEAAEIDGERITRLELAQAVQRRRSILLQQYGELDPETISDELLNLPVLQDMARAKVLENQARKTGMVVASTTLSNLLKQVEIFQSDGQFSKENYLLYLAQNQYTPQTHRKYLEAELLVSQLGQGIGNTGFLTRNEQKQLISLMDQSRDFHYLILPLEEVRNNTVVSPLEIDEYYQENQTQFTAPETVSLDYIELNLADLADDIELDETSLKDYYQQQVDAAEASKRLFVGHIMVDTQDDGAHQEILGQALLALEKGDEFSEVAQQYSEDPLSAEQGGELGEFFADSVPPIFRRTVEELDVGQVSEPVEIDDAWHIIKVLREEKNIVRSFEEERDRFADELRLQLAMELLPEKVDELAELSYNSETLAEVAGEMGLELKTSSPLTPEGPVESETVNAGIGLYSAVLDVAFSEDVLDNGYASEVLELGEGVFVVVKLKEHSPTRTLSIDEVREQVEVSLKTEKALLALKKSAEGYASSIRSGQSVESVATANNLTWQVSLGTRRHAVDVNREVVRQVFSLPAVTPLPAVRSFTSTAGDVIVYSLNAIHAGSEDKVAGENVDALQASLLRSSSMRDFSAYQNQLLAEADIEFNSLPDAN